MSDTLVLLSPWVEHLSVTVRDGCNVVSKMDFNRFRFVGIPPTKAILSGSITSANRDHHALHLFKAFNGREDAAPSTKFKIFKTAMRHFVFCEKHDLMPLTKEAVASFLNHLSARQRRGEIKDSYETHERLDLYTLLAWLELPARDWIQHTYKGKTQVEPAHGYSDGDLKKMLPLLRALFKQLYQQFISEPSRHIFAYKTVKTMTFDWKGRQYEVSAAVSKMICTATYLLSYYTWSNSSVLYQLKRPHIVSHKLSDGWHKMPAFKRRAFKTITVEIGPHDHLEIPKYALQFFDQLLHVSNLINPDQDGWLLPLIDSHGEAIMMNGSVLQSFKGLWLNKHFPMTDDRGERLWPVIQRFRATGGKLALAHSGPIATAQLLDNTPNVVKLAYSSGNPHENNKMNRDTSHTLEQAVRDRNGVTAAKQKVREAQNVKVLAYEAYLQYTSPPSRSANGSYCKDHDGDNAQRYTSRAQKRGLLPEGERLACADLLSCWVCEHQVLVESVHDVWCVLSFRECLMESQYQHLNSHHHQKNFGQVIENIDARLKLINNQVLRQAELKMANDGRHPLWPDAAIISVFSEGKTWH